MTATLTIPDPTWFIGCGNMGGAILDGWRAAQINLSPVKVVRPSGKTIDGISVVTSPEEAGEPPRLALLAFKPQKLPVLAPQLRQFLGRETVVVSVLAGVELATLRSYFPEAQSVVRALPSLPVAVRRGITGLYGEVGDLAVKQKIGDLFVALGYAMWMADERKLAALGSVAGAGPAYVARFISALAKAGARRGLSNETAATLALETVLGTAWLATSGVESMESIARRVASPNGTTEAGLRVLDGEDALDQLIAATVDAAAERGAELAEEAKSAGSSLKEAAHVQ